MHQHDTKPSPFSLDDILNLSGLDQARLDETPEEQVQRMLDASLAQLIDILRDDIYLAQQMGGMGMPDSAAIIDTRRQLLTSLATGGDLDPEKTSPCAEGHKNRECPGYQAVIAILGMKVEMSRGRRALPSHVLDQLPPRPLPN